MATKKSFLGHTGLAHQALGTRHIALNPGERLPELDSIKPPHDNGFKVAFDHHPSMALLLRGIQAHQLGSSNTL